MADSKASESKKSDSSSKSSDGSSTPAGGKVVVYDQKTDTFHLIMTKEASPQSTGLVPTYQQQMDEAKETCKGDAAPSVIENCKASQTEELVKKEVKAVSGYEIGGAGLGPTFGIGGGGKEFDPETGGGKDKPTSVTVGAGISF